MKNIKVEIPQEVGDGLILRTATKEDDQQLIDLAFHALDEAEEDSPFVKIFVRDWTEGKFPILRHQDVTLVEDTNTGQIVSSMCLFSEIWRYGGTSIKVGRPELVMTHENYRRRGLIRQQFEVIHALSLDRGEVMQVITGIPSLYREFGYELCLDLGGGYRIYPSNFPELADDQTVHFSLHPPTTDEDRLFVRRLHEENTEQMLFSIEVDDEIWSNEFDGYSDGSDGKFHWLVIKDKSGQHVGYIQHNHIFWGPLLNVNFIALTPGVGYLNVLPSLLDNLWKIAQEKLTKDTFKHPTEVLNGIYLRLGREHPIYDAIGRDVMLRSSPYAWYTRFPDEVEYLRVIKSQLETHLADSVGAGFSGDIKLNFYKRGAHLIFDRGGITVKPWKPQDGSSGDAHFPANSFWSLLCGQRTAAQLSDEIADCFMNRTSRIVLDCLFPQFNGQVWVVGGGA